jgi:hypothetical protein
MVPVRAPRRRRAASICSSLGPSDAGGAARLQHSI